MSLVVLKLDGGASPIPLLPAMPVEERVAVEGTAPPSAPAPACAAGRERVWWALKLRDWRETSLLAVILAPLVRGTPLLRAEAAERGALT